MTNVKDLTTMCKAGNIKEAYNLAKTVLSTSPKSLWAQRGISWVLYYIIKSDVDEHNHLDLFTRLDEFATLDLLTTQGDSLIFEKLLWKLAEFIKNTPQDRILDIEKIFNFVKHYTFIPTKGYSYFLKVHKNFPAWDGLVDFFEWWNLDNLLPEDYQEFTNNGKKTMSLAEQIYIAYSKALLKLNDKGKIQNFIPKIENLMELYPNMIYPGYYCGKLMLALKTGKEEALQVIRSFVRKKKSEFWVWQLLSEFYKDEPEMQMACLLRAVHCKTKENFLGKVRIKLISLYLAHNNFPHAKYHLEQLVKCYIQNGWNFPFDVQDWLRESWVQKTVANGIDNMDYILPTNKILQVGTTMSISIVTYLDLQNKRASIVYGEKRHCTISLSELPFNVKDSSILKLFWLPDRNNKISIICIEPCSLSLVQSLSYIKQVNGIIEKRSDKSFAFLKEHNNSYYISPNFVQKYGLNNREKITALVAYNYNRKKDEWTWMCLSFKR